MYAEWQASQAAPLGAAQQLADRRERGETGCLGAMGHATRPDNDIDGRSGTGWQSVREPIHGNGYRGELSTNFNAFQSLTDWHRYVAATGEYRRDRWSGNWAPAISPFLVLAMTGLYIWWRSNSRARR